MVPLKCVCPFPYNSFEYNLYSAFIVVHSPHCCRPHLLVSFQYTILVKSVGFLNWCSSMLQQYLSVTYNYLFIIIDWSNVAWSIILRSNYLSMRSLRHSSVSDPKFLLYMIILKTKSKWESIFIFLDERFGD